MGAIADTTSRGRTRAGNALIAIPGVMLVGAAVVKIAGAPSFTAELEAFGFVGMVPLLGAIELASAILLLVPATRALGAGLTSAFLGGAIATHLQHGQPPISPAVLLAVIWTGIWLRYRSVRGVGLRLPDEEPAATIGDTQTFWQFAPWLGRLVLGVAAFIFLMIGLRFLRDPIAAAAASGITLARGLGTTNLRVGLGAFPIGCAIAIASCLWSRRLLPLGLIFVAVMIGTAIVVRAYGIAVDGTALDSRRVLTAEAIVFGLTTLALAAEVARRRTSGALMERAARHR